jgi:hypothetical protein
MVSTSLITGKWVYGPEPSTVSEIAGGIAIRVNGLAVAIHPEGGSWPETLANARLISKAPEMLDLLVDALGNLDFAGGDDELTEEEVEWRDRALALISTLEVR